MFHRISWKITVPYVCFAAIFLAIGHIFIWMRLQENIHLNEAQTLLPVFRSIITDYLLLSILFLVIHILVFPFYIKRALRPMQDISAAVWQIAETEPLPLNRNRDEISELSLAVNAMAKQLRLRIDALKSERTTLNAVLQNMNDGVMIVDDNGKLLLFNHAAEGIFQLTSQNIIHKTLAETVRYHQVVDLWQQQQRTKEEQITYLELGTPRKFLQGIAISLEQALPGCTLLIFQDITRVHHLETVRRDFVSNISHELRTPLASLKALSETLQNGALDDPPAAKHFLNQIETEVDSLSQMVAELLELSRIESGKVPLKLQIVHPIQLHRTAYSRLALQAQRAELNVILDCDENLPSVLADPTRIEQVIVNLFHNAIKFTEAGGNITLHAHQQATNIIFSVKDSGFGISSDDLPRIFERFYKADPSRRKGGTGLGLAISRKLVEAHGGTIWVESVEGRGSTFFFSLPMA